ncbi:MAG: ribonucleoside triphosphate reductase [Candidatus Bathyarchaeia archaeon]
MPLKIKKRDGSVVDFDPQKIRNAIRKAMVAVGIKEEEPVERATSEVLRLVSEIYGRERMPSVEEIQDIVETALMKLGYFQVAKAYIIYREQHKRLRDAKNLFFNVGEVVNSYMARGDWRVSENANLGYSFSGLLWHATGTVMAHYALSYIYPKEVAEAHLSGDFHLHNLSMSIAGYCAGWNLRQLLLEGFNGVPGKVESKPPRHLRTALGQIVNFFGTLQNEWAGAQAFNSFDTFLAPFVRVDGLDYQQVKQAIQEFVFGVNISSRWGGQTPFTNITFDWRVPEDLKDEPAVVCGEVSGEPYGEYQEEMDLINKAFIEILTEGDMSGRVFTFPIPTYNITRDFDWDSENSKLLFEMTAKYGLPYFQNFVNSDLKPSDVRAMCCRLQLNLRELRKKTGGLFGSGESTGSIGVVTINMPRIGYLSKDDDDFFERLEALMELAKTSLEIKRKVVSRNIEQGLLPYTRRYLGNLKRHFSTIGLIGMNEACLNFLGTGIASKEGKEFSIRVLKFMREKLLEFQEETGNIYNLEATPGEGASYRLARLDREKYPDIITAGRDAPYYTNSTHLPVDATDDIFEALRHQEDLQTLYTGGTVFHAFIGERIESGDGCALLVRRIAERFRIPYYTITPTFSICPVHGYLSGEHFECPSQHSEEELRRYGGRDASGRAFMPCEVYSRVVGYYRPVQLWNRGKQEEYSRRLEYAVQ